MNIFIINNNNHCFISCYCALYLQEQLALNALFSGITQINQIWSKIMSLLLLLLYYAFKSKFSSFVFFFNKISWKRTAHAWVHHLFVSQSTNKQAKLLSGRPDDLGESGNINFIIKILVLETEFKMWCVHARSVGGANDYLFSPIIS